MHLAKVCGAGFLLIPIVMLVFWDRPDQVSQDPHESTTRNSRASKPTDQNLDRAPYKEAAYIAAKRMNQHHKEIARVSQINKYTSQQGGQDSGQMAEIYERSLFMNPIRQAQLEKPDQSVELKMKPLYPHLDAPPLIWQHDDPELDSY